MKVDLDVSKLIDVDTEIKTRIKELEKENKKLSKLLETKISLISTLRYEIMALRGWEFKYTDLKNKVSEFLKLGE